MYIWIEDRTTKKKPKNVTNWMKFVFVHIVTFLFIIIEKHEK